MEFDPLVILKLGEEMLWVAGAEHSTRSDGSSCLMVAQAYYASCDLPELTALVDEVGQSWVLTSGISKGFYMTGIILEREDYARKIE